MIIGGKKNSWAGPGYPGGHRVDVKSMPYEPNAPDFHSQWYLRHIEAPKAWGLQTGAKDVVIAVIDSGIDLSHPNLAPNIISNIDNDDWDFADPDIVPEPDRDAELRNHGTQCAGLAAAADNDAGIIGIAPGCSILPLRINLWGGANKNRANAIQYAVEFSRKYNDRLRHMVINCSWSAEGDDIELIRTEIERAVSNNILVCVAAGNEGVDIKRHSVFPANMTQVLTVAATDEDDSVLMNSNYGKNVDVCAPGKQLYTTAADHTYESMSGTSAAAPLVAGLAGLIWSKNPALNADEVKLIIKKSCEDIYEVNDSLYLNSLGNGRINAYNALMATS